MQGRPIRLWQPASGNPRSRPCCVVRVAVAAAPGSPGTDVVPLLTHHQNVKLEFVTSEQASGLSLGDLHRTLGFLGLSLEAVDAETIAGRVDFALTAFPHGASTPVVR